MTAPDRVRDLIITLSRSWHPSREQVQRIVDAVRGVEVEMQTPDASTVTEEAVEAALAAWSGAGGWPFRSYAMQRALIAALPHLTATKDAEIAIWKQQYQDAVSQLNKASDAEIWKGIAALQNHTDERCPFDGPGDPGIGIAEPCPICGDIGTWDSRPSGRCVSHRAALGDAT